MLDPTWALTRPILWLALAALVALLTLRTIRKDRKEYQRFKRYRTTAKRQEMFRRWLLDSFLSFGGLALVLLLLAGQFVAPLLQELAGWPGLRDIRALIADNAGFTVGAVIGLAIGLVALTALGVRAARTEQEIMTVGDIRSILPRNRQELRLGALLSINAGVVEELVFRLALPAAIYAASGSALAAVLGSVLLFGALHLYQGVAGIIGTAVVGAIMMVLYVISGTIMLPILLHAIFDLRSLVLIPAAIYRVHRIDGNEKPFIGALTVPAPAPAPAPEPESEPAAE
ncbi:MAG: CPBP family intramembrane metalloprotease [Salinibacterium sp.]|nr:CPBP family intramembrane metalloprotease [Salinibacterium sp.]